MKIEELVTLVEAVVDNPEVSHGWLHDLICDPSLGAKSLTKV